MRAQERWFDFRGVAVEKKVEVKCKTVVVKEHGDWQGAECYGEIEEEEVCGINWSRNGKKGEC